MKNLHTQTFRYKITHWLLFIVWGTICLAMAGGMVLRNFSDLLSGKFDLLDYVGFVFIPFICLPFGLLSFAVPLCAKIVVSAQGIEYHTISAVTKAKWSDLSVALIQSPSRVSKTLVAAQPEVELRNWAKRAPWDVAAGIKELGIPFSQFGLFNGQNLLASIDFHAPHLKIDE